MDDEALDEWEAYLAVLAKEQRKRMPLPEELELGWELFKNPLFVWAAIAECDDLGSEYPRWIKDYLTTSADKIFGRYINKEGEDAAKNTIKRILGFNSAGRGNIFTQYNTQRRNVTAFIALATFLTEHPNAKHEPILERFAKEYKEDIAKQFTPELPDKNAIETAQIRLWIHRVDVLLKKN